MKKTKERGTKRAMFVLLCIAVFLISFIGSLIFKMKHTPNALKKYSVDWDDSIGSLHSDIPYGDLDSNKFDLYLPADDTKETYGLVIYLHAGGFTEGDKADDASMLQWLCSKGYVAAGVNYTLFSEQHPDANVYTQSQDVKNSVPYIIDAAKELGYNIDQMAISGGSAGGCLALLYAYRDADTSPVPVKMVFEAVGPSCFYAEDWINIGQNPNEPLSLADADISGIATIFSAMAGTEITSEMITSGDYLDKMRNISAIEWITGQSVPTVSAYGSWDRMQAFLASKRLDAALSKHNIPHEYIVCEHSGHGLQNDNDKYLEYMEKIEEYLNTYMPTK